MLVGQNNCSNPQVLFYSNSFSSYQTFQFSDSLLWFSFTADSAGTAYLSIDNDMINSAQLSSLVAYSGSCNNLLAITSVVYTDNDSLSVMLNNLTYNQMYWLKLKRVIINGCFTCNANTKICLVSYNSSSPNQQEIDICNNNCFSGNIVINGDFDHDPPDGFVSGYAAWPGGNASTHNTWWVGDNSNQYSPMFLSPPNGSGVPASSPRFLMCDMHMRIPIPEPIIWESTFQWLLDKEMLFSFYAINLDPDFTSNLVADPQIEVIVNGVVISPININNGMSNTADIPNDEQWHQLCYKWTNTNNFAAVIQIRQLRHLFTSGYDLGIDHIVLMIKQDPPVITTQPTPVICWNIEEIDLGNYVSVTSGTEPYSYQWSNLSTPGLSNLVKQTTAKTYFLTVTDVYGCTATAQLTVNVDQPIPPFTITGNNNNCSANVTYTASLSNPNLLYTWSIVCPAGNTCGIINGNATSITGFGLSTVTVTWDQTSNFPPIPGSARLHLSISNACEDTVSIPIFTCCDYPGATIDLSNSTISSNLVFTSETIKINGDLHITGNVQILGGSGVHMGAMSRIIVHEGASLIVEGEILFQEICHAYMWDGIYAENANAFVTFRRDGSLREPIIKDAVNGIVSRNGGRLLISNTNFDQNFNSITISNYSPNHPDYYGPLQVIIEDCSFDFTPPFLSGPHLLQYPPKQDSIPNAGILVNSAVVSIGTMTATNNFNNLARGIFSINSDIQLSNASFSDCPPEDILTYSWPYEQAAILFIGTQEENSIIPSLTTGLLNGLTFNNCHVGVSTQNSISDIKSCLFTDCTMPIHVLNPVYPVTISENYITKGGLNPDYDIAGTGISVINANPAVSDEPMKTWVENNTIEGMQHGIHFFNQNNVGHFPPNEHRIFENTITFDDILPKTARAYRHGILAENCDGINIYGNMVDYPNWAIDNNLNNRGLRISRSPGSYVAHNTFTSVDAGIYTNGELQNTQFLCNTFIDCWNGFFFGDATAMSDQHFYYNHDYYCNNNRWIGSYGYSGNHYKLTQDVLKSNLANIFDWYYDPSITNNEFKPDVDLITQLQQHYCSTIIYCPTDIDNGSICPFVDEIIDDPSSGLDTIKRSYLFADILNEQIVYDTLIGQNRYYEKDYLYTFLLRNSSLINLGGPDDEAYQNFLDSLYNTNSYFIQKVYGFMQGQRLDSASYYNDMISFSDTWVENRKAVNIQYLNYWASGNYEIFEDDSLALLSIALQTPYEGGDGVYTARCLLNLFDVESMGTAYSSMIPEKGFAKLRVWPNPAEDWVTIELPVVSEQPSMLEICSMDGRIIREEKVSGKTTEHRLSTSKMDNGCYFVRVKSANTVVGIGRFCVIH
jgi:hypothetical protein